MCRRTITDRKEVACKEPVQRSFHHVEWVVVRKRTEKGTFMGSSQLSSCVNTYACTFLYSLHAFYSISCHPLASAPASRSSFSRRPPSPLVRQPRLWPSIVLRVISQNDHDGPDCTLSPALDLALNSEDKGEEQQRLHEEQAEDGARYLFMAERWKRGRKGRA